MVLAKDRVTPIRGYTIPRSELSAGVLVSRMMLRVVKALQGIDTPPISNIMLLDSKCTISTLEVSSSHLKPFFHNRRSELLENMDAMAKICEVENVHWVCSADNVADLLTRGTVKLDEIGPKSIWMKGPKFLQQRRELWPVHRDYVRVELPEDEMRATASYLRVAALKVANSKNSKIDFKDDMMPEISHDIMEVL